MIITIKFLKPYSCRGFFEEPVYDEYPGFASYTKPIEKSFKTGDVLDVIVINSGKVQLMESGYGVSIHSSDAFLYMDIQALKNMGVLYKMTADECEKVYALNRAEEAYIDAWEKIQMHKNYIKEYSDQITESDIDSYVACIFKYIHAQADFILAKY